MLQAFDERNRDLIVSVGGRLTHRDEAAVSPFDSAVQGGDAVWEGLRLYDGRVFKLVEHLDRLRDSAKALAFAEIPSHEAIIAEIRRTLEANRMRDGVHIRLTLTRGVKITSGMDPRLNASGPTLIVLAEHKPPVYAAAIGSNEAGGGLKPLRPRSAASRPTASTPRSTTATSSSPSSPRSRPTTPAPTTPASPRRWTRCSSCCRACAWWWK